jgi:hypothetical protein
MASPASSVHVSTSPASQAVASAMAWLSSSPTSTRLHRQQKGVNPLMRPLRLRKHKRTLTAEAPRLGRGATVFALQGVGGSCRASASGY